MYKYYLTVIPSILMIYINVYLLNLIQQQHTRVIKQYKRAASGHNNPMGYEA